MANPRQRRKSRSATHKAVHQSRRPGKKLKKQPPIRGPKVLQEAWDKRKTVRQNYAALGLTASLTPAPSGGVEKMLVPPCECAPSPERDASTIAATSSSAGSRSLPKGHGRIIRDEAGNVVDIELAEDDAEEAAMENVVEDLPDPAHDAQLAPWVQLGSHLGDGRQTERASAGSVIQALEEMTRTCAKRPARHSSTGEIALLRRLVGKYGQNVEKMARDRKLNPEQRTAGELTRAIKRAGGFAELSQGGEGS